MINDKMLIVSGVAVKLKPYTEKRFELLKQVTEEIQAYIAKNPEITIEEVDKDLRAKWWKRKAEILWEPETELKLDFFKSDTFEFPLLKETEDFFIRSRLYL